MGLSQSEAVPVMVLGNGGSALGIARSLGRLGAPVYVVSSVPQLAAFDSRYCRGKVLSEASEFKSRSVQHLLQAAVEISRKPILIPTDDQSAVFIEDHAEALLGGFVFPRASRELARSLCNKKEMYFLARRCKIATAKSVFPKCRREVSDFAIDATYPIMVKQISSRGFPVNKMIVETNHELLRHYDSISNPLAANLMLQEYIPGEDDTAWIFAGYFNHRSDCLFGFTGRKLRQWPTYHGITTIGVCQQNEAVAKTAKRFMKEIGFRGIVDIDFRQDSRNGEYKVLDVNPRVGGNFRLFVSDKGMDVARALYLDLTGQEVISGTVPEGRKWVVEDIDLRACIRYHADRNLTIKKWVSSYRGTSEFAIFTFDDPFPFFHAVGRRLLSLGHVLSRSP